MTSTKAVDIDCKLSAFTSHLPNKLQFGGKELNNAILGSVCKRLWITLTSRPAFQQICGLRDASLLEINCIQENFGFSSKFPGFPATCGHSLKPCRRHLWWRDPAPHSAQGRSSLSICALNGFACRKPDIFRKNWSCKLCLLSMRTMGAPQMTNCWLPARIVAGKSYGCAAAHSSTWNTCILQIKTNGHWCIIIFTDWIC